jgi:uncharacterized protein YjbI with pentapeptide repeats
MTTLTRESAQKNLESARLQIAEAEAFLAQNDMKEEKKLGITIMSHWMSAIIVYQSTKETTKEAVIEAVSSGADLRGADLSGANLRGANLLGASLSDADLRGAELMNAKFYGKGGRKELKRSQLPDFLAALGFTIVD